MVVAPTKPDTHIGESPDVVQNAATAEPTNKPDAFTTVEQIRRVVMIDNKIIQDERMEETEYPIICYQPERFAGKLYPTAWMEPIIELNKSINKIYTSLEDRVHTFSKGRFLVKRNENIDNITNDNGQIVYYDNIPPTYMQQ